MTGAAPYPLLPELLRSLAVEQPDGLAVLDIEAAVRWSWSDLDRRAEAIADAVRSLDLGPGDRVGLAVGPSALGVAGLHGVMRSGITAMMVHPTLPPAAVAALLIEASCRALLIDPVASAGRMGAEAAPGVQTILLQSVSAGGGLPSSSPNATVDAELIVPTSGTSARPKLARLPLDRIAASARAWTSFLPPATGWLLSLGLAHVAGIGIVARATGSAVPLVIPKGSGAAALLDALERAREQGVVVSHLSLVATQLAAILDHTLDGPPPDGVTAVVLGGGPLPDPLLRRGSSAGWPLFPSYGMTETSSGVVALHPGEIATHVDQVGRPLDGVELRVTDGRIQLRGPMVFAGYLDGGPTETTTVLDADGWLDTGDLGRLDADGRLTVLGRSDDVIISGGEKIAPATIEAVLLDHPGMRDVAVVGVPDATWGSVPVAVVVVRPDPDGSADGTGDDALFAYARTRLPRHGIPVRFARVNDLPRNQLGKPVRSELLRIATGSLASSGVVQGSTDDGARLIMVTTDDGQDLAVRDVARASGDVGDPEAPVVVLLHATLSTSGQLLGLARRLAEAARVVLVDRRGSGDSRMAEPAPVPVERHAADVVEVLDRLGVQRAFLFGHSLGGVVALRATVLAAGRVSGLVVWEPPYLVLADPAVQAEMIVMTEKVRGAFPTDGPAAAARIFLEAVSGADAWERLPPRLREAVGLAGPGVLADVTMSGLSADGLSSLTCPIIIGSGDASRPLYGPIADRLGALIGPSSRRIDLVGLDHLAPITNPEPIATLVLDLLATTANTTTQERPE